MKRISFIITALLLLAALTQCKKEVQVSPASEGNTVDITLNIKGGGGSRVDVNTATGAVNYESGDNIYVVSGGRYVGTLTYNGTCFGGTITDPTVGEPLYFYFLGNVTPAETLVTGVTTTCSVVISDQTERLPVIECAPSNENYVSGSTTFTAMLLNKCALVKFNVTAASEAATCILGMKNKVTVNFSANTITQSREGNGIITLPAGCGERWAILLPQEAVEAGTFGSVYSEDGVYTGTREAIPVIANNDYLAAGIEVVVNTEVYPSEVPPGTICGKFTINENGDQVHFSKGNLQYNKTTDEWSFMEHQYDIVETNGQYVGEDYANQNIVSLFGWGTSGWLTDNYFYQPYSTSFLDESYSGSFDCELEEIGYGYGPLDIEIYDLVEDYGHTYTCDYDLTGNYANADWGVYNAISNGGNLPNRWRTLNKNEWIYILNERSTTTGQRYAMATVNGINGIILLPDDWNESYYTLNYIGSFDSNMINVSQWDILEQHGAVFLPAAGVRTVDEFNTENHVTMVSSGGNYGSYWSTSCDLTECCAISVMFNSNGVNANDMDARYYGRSVRLVCPVQ